MTPNCTLRQNLLSPLIAINNTTVQEFLGLIAVPFSCNQNCSQYVEQLLVKQISSAAIMHATGISKLLAYIHPVYVGHVPTPSVIIVNGWEHVDYIKTN